LSFGQEISNFKSQISNKSQRPKNFKFPIIFGYFVICLLGIYLLFGFCFFGISRPEGEMVGERSNCSEGELKGLLERLEVRMPV